MKVIAGTRRSGRTTRLIELCHESESSRTPSYIVCYSTEEARRIYELAKKLKKPVAFPISYDEFVNFKGAPVEFKFYIDNAEYLLQRLIGSPYEVTVAMTVDEILVPEVAA